MKSQLNKKLRHKSLKIRYITDVKALNFHIIAPSSKALASHGLLSLLRNLGYQRIFIVDPEEVITHKKVNYF